ncbi:flavodoxin [Xylella taiwanensis]|uniref:Flavodoxin n=1 Tax=Xylella taiwanensis TaxID=1444770 RepID=Z9JKT8_9GAMM|nr:flavodoxin [Xylella taiwanensis]AXI82999.1 flavodoxin [Xylella taiwanensis]EWS78451.1 flavodoxin [Xylella taiwanensis]MCD8456023.1 flavodoxin [Xylella taiwanensis]MCD8458427.1 flavodoxin [Xylella taiwanensis]MCD8460564.1 flavodoxin [Xylella taiwanensis]
MRILLALASLSGNTREVARVVTARCEEGGHTVDWIETDLQTLAGQNVDPRTYTLFLFGTWTDNGGRTPFEMKRCIAELLELIGKPACVAVFGTGETQWGHEYYCGAVHRIADFFASRFPRLLIEQMPHGERDVRAIVEWTDQVMNQCKTDSDADHYRYVA